MDATRHILPLALSALCAAATGCETPVVTDEEVPAGGLLFSKVTTGLEHSCALAQTGSVYCWGADRDAQLGNRASGDSPKPVRAESTARFIDVASGAYHTCAIEVKGELHCWGNNNQGQLGNGTTVTLHTPIIIPTSVAFTQIASGLLHSCALSSAGRVYCWGAGGQGQLGTGKFEGERRPAEIQGQRVFARITAGGFHTCGITGDGHVYCWGQNSHGQLGDSTLHNRAAPVEVKLASPTSIDAGLTHTCATTGEQQLFCWGSSQFGELGTSFTTNASVPGAVVPSRVQHYTGWTSVAAGAGFSCGVAAARVAYCWGRGFEGQLGNGQLRNWPTPQLMSDGEKVGEFQRFLQIDAGLNTHACALSVGGGVSCWGRGDHGQLGNNLTTFTSSAMRVSTQ